ncbi:Uncharacterized protein DBV15_01165 [Temnothorax longispinosus]|uniref:Uncharacterized protein n=1 Tax=Temnothorax longispinosus TaxID=300112 RepID=A0A4S2J9H0_9HYME|nr:Uncharacterized protein DBV15_01165 [Temnothorax longispinosus]
MRLFVARAYPDFGNLQLRHPRKLLEALRCRLMESADDARRGRRNLVQHYPKLPDLLNSNSESRMLVCPTRTVLSLPTVPRAVQSVDRQQRPVRKTVPLAQHSSSFVATRIELPVVDITCTYNSYRYKTVEESLRERYGPANYPPGEVVLNYIQLNTPDSRTRHEDSVGDDLLDFFNGNHTGTYSSSVATKLETEYLNLLDHFVLRERGRALTAGKFTETPSFADERNLELSFRAGTWSQSTLRSSLAQERESGSSGNQRPSKGTKYAIKLMTFRNTVVISLRDSMGVLVLRFIAHVLYLGKRIMIVICLGIEYSQGGGANRRLSSLQRVLRR